MPIFNERRVCKPDNISKAPISTNTLTPTQNKKGFAHFPVLEFHARFKTKTCHSAFY